MLKFLSFFLDSPIAMLWVNLLNLPFSYLSNSCPLLCWALGTALVFLGGDQNQLGCCVSG